MRKLFTTLLITLLALPLSSQVVNQAISLQRNGRVSLGAIQELEAASAITLQWWMNPKQWIPGANILTWGDKLNVQLSTPTEVKIQVNGEEFTFADANLVSGNWSHITLILENSSLSLLINNANQQSQDLAESFAADSTSSAVQSTFEAHSNRGNTKPIKAPNMPSNRSTQGFYRLGTKRPQVQTYSPKN